MKYVILGFQQQKLINENLTVEDAFILRTIKDMFGSASMEFKDIEGTRYMWVNYTYLLKQMPIVGSKRNLMRRIEKFGNQHLLLRVMEFTKYDKKNDKDLKGKFAYIAPTVKLDELQDYDPALEEDEKKNDLMTESHKDLMTKSHKGYDKIAYGDMTKSHNKDTSNKIDPSIKDTKEKNILSFEKKKDDIYKREIELFNLWNDLKAGIQHKEKTFESNKHKIKTAIKNHGYDELVKAITRMDQAVKDQSYWYYCNWNLINFLTQKNGFTNWLDEGQYYNNYLNRDKGNSKGKKSNNSEPDKDGYITTKGSFGNFKQRNYDFKDLEKKLLGWQNEEEMKEE